MRMIWILMIATMLCYGCATPGPAESKSDMGNLAIHIQLDGRDHFPSEIYIDDVFIGNASPKLPILYLKRGDRKIRIEAKGFKTFERTITILGEPNRQQLNVVLERIPQKEASYETK